MNDLPKDVSEIHNTNYDRPYFKRIAATLRKGGLRALCRLLMENLVSRKLDAGTSQHRQLLLPAAADIFEIALSRRSNRMNGDAIVMESTKWRQFQKFAVVDLFNVCNTEIFDKVLIT